ncbi:hypothetical protein GGF32_007988 [Allomyces javanicus]|nr:hypothetical protein GGF32_007988 [Allomyces javanicus]
MHTMPSAVNVPPAAFLPPLEYMVQAPAPPTAGSLNRVADYFEDAPLSAATHSRSAEEDERIRHENETLRTENESLKAQVAQLQARLVKQGQALQLALVEL